MIMKSDHTICSRFRKRDLTEKNSVVYMDKSVVEHELPELIVCYKENTYHVVKDICIDEGVPMQDKYLFACGVDEKSICNSQPPEKDQNHPCIKENDELVQVIMKESQENNAVAQDNMKSPGETNSDKHIGNICNPRGFMLSGEVNGDAMDKPANDVSKEAFTLGDILSMPELNMEKSGPVPSSNSSNELEQSSQSSSGNTTLAGAAVASAGEELNSDSGEAVVMHLALVPAAEEPNKDNQETNLVGSAEEISSSSDNLDMASCITEELINNNSLDNEVSSGNKIETEGINVDHNSRIPMLTGGKEYWLNLDSEHLESKSTSVLKDLKDQSVSGHIQNGIGETSFSATGPISGLISYSGPIAYSGSLSLRSDSSTTSTRSFAFPVLQSEWNSSPVRMAKADRRYLRKHRGWRRGLLCCKF